MRVTAAGIVSLAEPVAAALLGVLLLHEHLSLAALAGCALKLAGMITACLPRLPGARRVPTATAPPSLPAGVNGARPGELARVDNAGS